MFNKEHKNVLRDVDRLIEKVKRSEEKTGNFEGAPKFGATYFFQSTYVDKWNREKREYLLTKNGFILVVEVV